MSNCYQINFTDIKSDRFDAEFFRPDHNSILDKIYDCGEVTTLNKLFKYIKRGTQPKYSEKGEIKVLRSVNVGGMSFNGTRQEYVDLEFFENSQRGKVKENDILITSTGVGTLGRTSIWTESENVFCDGHITILRDSSVSSYLITAYLNSKYGLFQFDKHYRGSSGQIEIYPFDIKKFVIPNVLFDYSKEIEQKIKKAIKLENDSKNLYKEAEEELLRLTDLENLDTEDLEKNVYRSSFSEIVYGRRFDSEFYNPKSKYIIEKIRNLNYTKVSENFIVKNGYPWKSNMFFEDNSGEPVIRIRDIKPGYIKNYFLTSLDTKYAHDIDFPKAKPLDIVIGMDGAKYFYSSLVEEDCLVNQRVCHIKLQDKNIISPEFTTLVINSLIGQSQLMKEMTIAGTVGHITNSNVANLVIPILDREDHEKLTEMVRNSIDYSKKSKKLFKEAISKIELVIDGN